jgi:hypothetical protein
MYLVFKEPRAGLKPGPTLRKFAAAKRWQHLEFVFAKVDMCEKSAGRSGAARITLLLA